jgi:succinyl-CoA synthetase alpha subunit
VMRTSSARPPSCHASAIIAGSTATTAEKIAALGAAGVPVVYHPSPVPELVRTALAAGVSQA